MNKPSPATILAALALTRSPNRPDDPIRACNICGKPSEKLGAWREHDPRDEPYPGAAALVFVGKDHPACLAELDAHPRLYAEETGEPGTFPQLCGDCVHRVRRVPSDSKREESLLWCSHRDLKANGGPGLKVELHNFSAIVCSRRGDGCSTPIREAVKCVGRELKQ